MALLYSSSLYISTRLFVYTPWHHHIMQNKLQIPPVQNIWSFCSLHTELTASDVVYARGVRASANPTRSPVKKLFWMQKWNIITGWMHAGGLNAVWYCAFELQIARLLHITVIYLLAGSDNMEMPNSLISQATAPKLRDRVDQNWQSYSKLPLRDYVPNLVGIGYREPDLYKDRCFYFDFGFIFFF